MTYADIDMKILSYFATHSSVSIEMMKNDLVGLPSLEYRIKLLSENDKTHQYLARDYREVQNGALTRIEYLNTYHITDAGKKALEDYSRSKRNANKELWLKNAWIPIIVAFVTTVLTNYMLPRLPEMIEWCFHTLSRIFS